MKKSINILILILLIYSGARSQYIFAVAGNGAGCAFSQDSIFATIGTIGCPEGITTDVNGNIYFNDSHNNRIRKVLANTGFIYTFAGTGINGHSGDSGLAIFANLHPTYGIRFDAMNNLYFAEARYIRRIDAATGIITTIAGTGLNSFNGDSILAINANISPFYFAFGSNNTIYFTDPNLKRVRKIDQNNGMITTVAGTGASGFGGDSGLAINAILNTPTGIALDAYENIYLSDKYNNRIRRIDHATGIITTIAGTGISGYNGDNIPALSAQLFQMNNLCFDASGNLLIADMGNSRIRKIDANSGIITTFAGTGIGGGYCCDSMFATSANFGYVYDIFLDAFGITYFVESSNRVLKITTLETNITETQQKNGKVLVYPNPSSNIITFRLSSFTQNETIQIMDIFGRVVYKENIRANDTQVAVSNWSSGVYFYSLNQGAGAAIRGKFIKE